MKGKRKAFFPGVRVQHDVSEVLVYFLHGFRLNPVRIVPVSAVPGRYPTICASCSFRAQVQNLAAGKMDVEDISGVVIQKKV